MVVCINAYIYIYIFIFISYDPSMAHCICIFVGNIRQLEYIYIIIYRPGCILIVYNIYIYIHIL